MVIKARERKLGPDKKDTSFKFGGMTWTSARAEVTVKRAGEGTTEIIGMHPLDLLSEQIVMR
jgi:hypothetical protein